MSAQNVDGDEGSFEPLVGEVVEDVDLGGAVPYPDDLTEEHGGASRFDLPDDLVRYKYPTVPSQSIRQPLSLNDRILVVDANGPSEQRTNLGDYESAVTSIEARFEFRVSRLRDLCAICRASEQRKSQLYEQRELEREALNWRNSEINRQIAQEIKSLQADWESFRAATNSEIRETEEALIEYKMARQREIEDARTGYWEVRTKAAQDRDVIVRKQRDVHEKIAEEELERARLARERADESQIRLETERAREREQLNNLAEDADKEHGSALTLASQAEIEAANRRNSECATARGEYQQALEVAYERVNGQTERLFDEAHAATLELEAERLDRANILAEVQQRAIDERRGLEKEIADAEKVAARASADAGITPGDSHEELRDIAKREITEDAIAPGTDTDHLHLPAQRPNSVGSKWGGWFRAWWHGFVEIVTLLGLGSIFGISLGMLLGVVDFTPESFQHGGAYYLAACTAIGIVIFNVLGRVAQFTTSHATEEIHAAKPGRHVNWTRIQTFAVLLGLIAFESCVERYGIVQSVIDKHLATTGDDLKLDLGRQFAYWAIALVMSTPYVWLHAYEGAKLTRHGLGLKRRREKLALAHHDAVRDPRISTAAAALGLLSAAKDRLVKIEAEHAIQRAEAERRVSEIDARIRSHPTVKRWNDFVTSDESNTEEDTIVKQRKAVLDLALEAHKNDPIAEVARQWEATAQARAEEARRRVEVASSPFRQALRDASGRLVEGATSGIEEAASAVGSGLVHAAADVALAGADAALWPLHLAAMIPRTPTEQPASSYLETFEETTARERWHSVRSSISNDPKVRFYRSRIQSLQALVRSADARYSRRHKQLRDQMRAVEVRLMAPESSNRMSAFLENAIYEEELNSKAAKMYFDIELARLRELAEVPRYFRWYVAWHHTRASRNSMQSQTSNVRAARFLPPGETLPGAGNQPNVT